MEEVGYRYFNELVSRQFFQLSCGNKSRYVMHNPLSISKRTQYLSLVGGVHDNSVIFESYANCLTTFLTLDYKGCHLRENELVRLFKMRLLLVLSSSHSYITGCPIQSVNWNIYVT